MFRDRVDIVCGCVDPFVSVSLKLETIGTYWSRIFSMRGVNKNIVTSELIESAQIIKPI